MAAKKRSAMEILADEQVIARRATAGPPPPRATGHVEVDEVIEALTDEKGKAPTKTKVAAALAQIDQEATLEEAKAAITWEIYDGTQVINGMSPAAFETHMRDRGDWPDGGAIYLGYENGQLSILQPHPPAVQGLKAMTKEEANKIAKAHLHDGFVLDRKNNEIVPLNDDAPVDKLDQLRAAAADPAEPDVYENRGMAQERARSAVIDAVRGLIE